MAPTLPAFERLRLRFADGVLHASLHNPPVQLLDAALTRELNALAKALAAADDVQVLIVDSDDPDFFLCHSDENELLALPPPPDPLPTEPGPFHRIMERLRTLPQITLGQVDGVARGGGLELLLALDLCHASDRSRFALPEVAVGLIPGGGGTQRLARRIGYGRALAMVAGGEDVDALTAERWGLVQRVWAPSDLADGVTAWARRVASFPPAAVRAAKQALQAAVAGPGPDLVAEEQLFLTLLRDPASRERVARFRDLGAREREPQLERFDAMMRALSSTSPPDR